MFWEGYEVFSFLYEKVSNQGKEKGKKRVFSMKMSNQNIRHDLLTSAFCFCQENFLDCDSPTS